MNKEEAYKILKDGGTLFVPTWYFTMESDYIFATCGQEDCCQDEFKSFAEFWGFHGHKQDMRKI